MIFPKSKKKFQNIKTFDLIFYMNNCQWFLVFTNIFLELLILFTFLLQLTWGINRAY